MDHVCPSARKVRVPPTCHNTLKKVAEVSTDDKNASTRSTGESVAMRTSSDIRYSGFSDPLPTSSRRKWLSASPCLITVLVTDSRHLRWVVMRPHTEVAARMVLRAASTMKTPACLHNATASRIASASKKWRFHIFKRYCTNSWTVTSNTRKTVKL